jgi:hypothetical protein
MGDFCVHSPYRSELLLEYYVLLNDSNLRNN